MGRSEAFDMLPRVGATLTKLGTSDGVQLSRVWMHGQPLVDAGFHRGAPFQVSPDDEDTALYLATTITAHDDTRILRVTGDTDNPTIEFTGKCIADFFKGHNFVHVHYSVNIIRIRGA